MGADVCPGVQVVVMVVSCVVIGAMWRYDQADIANLGRCVLGGTLMMRMVHLEAFWPILVTIESAPPVLTIHCMC